MKDNELFDRKAYQLAKDYLPAQCIEGVTPEIIEKMKAVGESIKKLDAELNAVEEKFKEFFELPRTLRHDHERKLRRATFARRQRRGHSHRRSK